MTVHADGRLFTGDVAEADPLTVFGPAASRMLRNLLADRGIALKVGAYAEKIERGKLHLRPIATLVAAVKRCKGHGPRAAGSS